VGFPKVRALGWFAVPLLAAAFFALPAGHPDGSPAQISRAAPLRVMALGDSITAGVGANGKHVTDGGYRGMLAERLGRSGYHVTFVGTRTDYSDELSDRAHEGWPGYVLRSFPSDPGPGQLLGSVTRKAILEDDPDVILLMAGTNDLLRLQKHAAGYTLPNILESFDLEINEIVSIAPTAFVIVAPVVESPKIDECPLKVFAGRAGCGASTESLKTIVDSYVQRGYRISLAPAMATAVPRDIAHFPDGIHPSGAGGYAAIADVWLHAIADITRPDQSNVADRRRTPLEHTQ
jgi:lysophospholipase L1-like esterase